MAKYVYPAIFQYDSINDVYYFEFVDFPHTFTDGIAEDELEYVPAEILAEHIENYLENGIPLPRPTSRAHCYYDLNRGEYWRRVRVEL